MYWHRVIKSVLNLFRLKSVLTYVDKECMDLSDKEFIDLS